ncbi:MAG: hypothetical protein Fur0018_17850 [Anaerolineales bacterium]
MLPSGRWWNRSSSAALCGGLLLAGLLLTLFSRPDVNGLRVASWKCPSWSLAAPPAMGMPAGPDDSYAGEEGFAALVFNGQLYLGMEADNTLGARLWRTRQGIARPQQLSDWEEVIADLAGRPFGLSDIAQNDHVDSLAVFHDQLYVTTANRSLYRSGFRVFRSPSGNPGSWRPADEELGAGFGDLNNENLKGLTVFGEWLCGGTWNETAGAAVWCTRDGRHWRRKSPPGVGAQPMHIAWTLLAHQGALYVAGQSLGNPDDPFDDRALVYRTRSLDGSLPWELVLDGGNASGRALLLGVFQHEIYLTTRSPAGVRVWRSESGAPASWQASSLPGMNRDRYNMDTIAGGGQVLGAYLYLSVYNPHSGVQLWRTPDGRPDTWKSVAPPGLNDYRNFAAVLVDFRNTLYAWTSNPVLGQQILRAGCFP